MARWIRVNLDWHTSAWLVALSAEARLVWILLLCYVKATGHAGRVKALDPLVASRLWFVGEESVRQLLIAAKADGALQDADGDWLVTNWPEYQTDETGAERQRRFRESHRNGSNALVTPVTPTGERHRQEKDMRTPPPCVPPPPVGECPEVGVRNGKMVLPSKQECVEYGASIGISKSESEKFWEWHGAKGWIVGKSLMKNWKLAMHTWKRGIKAEPAGVGYERI